MRMSKKNRAQAPRVLTAFIAAVALGVLALVGSGAEGARAVSCTYSLSSNAYSVNEGEAAQITVNQTGSCSEAPGLTLQAGSTATPNVDFVSFTFIGVTFPDGDGTPNSRVISISTIEDATSDAGESFTVVLNPPGPPSTSTIVGNSSATVTIVDDDGPSTYSYASATYNFTEGQGAVTVQVLRGGATGGTASVDCTVTGGSATGSGADYTVTDGTANFGVGDTTATCGFTIHDDATPDGTETITLGFANPVNLPGGASGQTTTTINITDNDGPGNVQFSASSYNVSEGAGTAFLTVTRVGGSTGTISVQCSTTVGGSATAASDYTIVSNQLLTFVAGDVSETCAIPILNDSTAEAQETVQVQLHTATGTSIVGTNPATLFIDDDDGSGNIVFTATSYSGPENGGPITISVSRTGGSGAGSVTYTASTGTAPGAVAGVDFVGTTGTLSWGVSDFATKTFTVQPIDDAATEGSENVTLTLSNPTGGLTLGSPSQATLVILDNETLGPVITSVSPSSGSVLGGTIVTITGLNFTGATSVSFGGSQCVISSNSGTVIVCTTTAHTSGLVEVIISTPQGQNTTTGSQNDFLYTGGPTVTDLSPNAGPASGNTIVTITGTNFTASGMVVRFGTTSAVFTYIDSTTIVAVAPAHTAGTVDVTVTTAAGTSPTAGTADDFTYTGALIPVVSAVSPNSGPIGTTVSITGSGFTGATSVTFGGVSATFTVNSDGQITASVPSGTPAGLVDVRVTTPSGTSANTSSDNFTNTSSTATVTYTLYFRFTLIVWTGPNNMNALAALRGQETPDNPLTNNVSALVGAIWRFDASTQTYKGYFPGSDNIPGANDFTTLQNGVGYFIALLNPGTVQWTAPGAN